MAKTSSYRQNETTFEIRFKPNGKLLDHRGKWAESISNQMQLKHWRIDTNRVNVFDETDDIHILLSYKSCGLTINDVPNKEFFANYSKKLLNAIFGLEHFGNPIYVERIGVRNLFCTPFSGSYDKLLRRYSERYLKIPEQAIKTIGEDSELTDIGGYLNFKDKLGNYNTMSGPMPKKQFSNFFSKKNGNFPDVGLFYDMDYWIAPKKNLAVDEVIEKIQELFVAGWDRHSRIKNLIVSG